MVKTLSLLLITLSLTGCLKSVPGKLEVFERLRLRSTDGREVLPAGTYTSNIRFKSKRKFNLIVKNGEKLKFKFKLPRGTKLPVEGGRLFLSSRDINQPADLEIDVRKTKDFGGVYRQRESCSIDRTVRRCRVERIPGRRVCRRRGNRRVCRTTPGRTRRVCRDILRTIPGERFVKYQDITVRKIIRADFLKRNTNIIKATFKARQRNTERRRLGATRCQIL